MPGTSDASGTGTGTTGAQSVDDENLLAAHTQRLLDAITTADPSVWAGLLDDAATVTDENGSRLTKADLVGSIRPHPPQVSASITAENLRVQLAGDTAVLTYVSDEHETFYGHLLHCRYRSTDTWIRRTHGWRLIASHVQALRADPPAVHVDAAEQASLTGTYTLAPERHLTIAQAGHELTLRENDRELGVLLPEARDVYFVPGRPRYRYLAERDRAGHVVAVRERREAWDLTWRRQP